MNEAMIYHFQHNVKPDEKALIYRNNKSENIALGNSLQDMGYKVVVVDSDSKNEEESIEILETEKLSGKTDVLITTSMLTEGINLLNKNITQIHYIDKKKSATTIRQFASRARNGKHKTFVWYKKEETLKLKKDIFDEWFDFTENAKTLEEHYNYIVKETEDKNRNKHINHLLKGVSFYNRTWRQFGYRNVNGEVKIDYTRIANYFYELDVENQSHNSYLLGEEMENHNFNVHYMNYDIDLNKADKDASKQHSKTVKEERKSEKIGVLQDYLDNDVNVKARLSKLLRKRNKTSSENREIKIAKEWLQLQHENVNKDDILEILKNNNTHKAKFRLSLKGQMQNDLLYKELTPLLSINERYDSEQRNDLLSQAEKSVFDKHKIELNIKKMYNGEIHGKTSKGIFAILYNINSHVYNGKHSISVTDFDPLFFKTSS